MPKRKEPNKQEERSKKPKLSPKEKEHELQIKTIEELFILAREDRFLNNDISVLHLASLVGREDIVRYLVRNLGAKLNVKARRGETPLHMIACHGGKQSTSMARTLVELGAEIDAKDSRGFTPLMFAAFNGDIRLARLLVQMGASIHATCCNGLTVLHYAAMQDHFDIVKELVKSGVHVDSVEVRGYTPLHLAVVYGRTKLVEYLVNSAGADLTKRDPQGFDVLQIAFHKGDIQMAKLLLKQKVIRDKVNPIHKCAALGNITSIRALLKSGSQVDESNERKQTPLHWAAMAGNLKTAKELIKLGADIDAQDDKALTPMHWAAMTGHEALVSLLSEAGAEFLDDNRGHTPLHCAAEYYGICSTASAEAVIRTLVKLDADLEARTDVGCSPLHIAVHHDHEDAARLLVKLGAEVNAVDNKQFTPLHHAALEGRCSVIRTLLSLGADLVAKNENGLTPLHVAAFKGHTDAVRDLVRCGADLSVKNDDQQTALHMASIKGHIETVKALLELGAKVMDKEGSEGDGLSAVHDAARNGQFAVTRLLFEMRHFRSEHDRELLIHSAAYGGNVELVEFLVDKGLDVFLTEKGETTIYGAAMNGKTEMVALLSKKGVSVKSKGIKNQTALHIAAAMGHIDTVKLLIELGAEIDCKTEEGRTPLFCAVVEGRTEVVEELAKKGASVTPSVAGITALSAASERGYIDVTKVLFAYGVKPNFPALTQEEECTICYDRMVYKIELECGHSFCYLCVVGLKGGKETKCPNCRNPFSVSL